jgi:hypothetical protein
MRMCIACARRTEESSLQKPRSQRDRDDENVCMYVLEGITPLESSFFGEVVR